jgi:hypothetical protein
MEKIVTFEKKDEEIFHPSSINICINTTFIHESKNIKRLGIHTYYYIKNGTLNPYIIDNGDIVLFFLGRLFFQDENVENLEDNTYTEKYILNIYKKYGFQYLLKKLNGVFSFILLDQSYQKDESIMYIVTDPFGLIPIYYTESNLNTIEFSTEYKEDSSQITLPAASYCKLFYTNKVSSIWSFDKEESIPTYNHEIKYWVYPKRKFKYYKYRMFHGGQHPFDIDYIENMEKQVNLYLYDSIIYSIEKSLYKAFQLRLYHFQQYDIYCVGNPYDKEFLLIKNMLSKILDNFAGSKPLFHTVYINSLQDEESQNYLELLLKINQKMPVTIFASSGFVLSEKTEARKNYSESNSYYENIMNYDAKLYDILDTIVPNEILPKIVEPLKKRGILVEFPFLEEQWLEFYLSILPRIRYQHPLHRMLSDRVPLESKKV